MLPLYVVPRRASGFQQAMRAAQDLESEKVTFVVADNETRRQFVHFLAAYATRSESDRNITLTNGTQCEVLCASMRGKSPKAIVVLVPPVMNGFDTFFFESVFPFLTLGDVEMVLVGERGARDALFGTPLRH